MKDKSEIQTVWFRHEEKTQPFCLHVHKILNMVLIIPHTLTSNKKEYVDEVGSASAISTGLVGNWNTYE